MRAPLLASRGAQGAGARVIQGWGSRTPPVGLWLLILSGGRHAAVLVEPPSVRWADSRVGRVQTLRPRPGTPAARAGPVDHRAGDPPAPEGGSGYSRLPAGRRQDGSIGSGGRRGPRTVPTAT